MRNSDWIKSINRNDQVLLYFVWRKTNGLSNPIDNGKPRQLVKSMIKRLRDIRFSVHIFSAYLLRNFHFLAINHTLTAIKINVKIEAVQVFPESRTSMLTVVVH